LSRRQEAANEELRTNGATAAWQALEQQVSDQQRVVDDAKRELGDAKKAEKEAKKNFEAQDLIVKNLAVDNDALFDLIKNKGPIANSDPNSHMYQQFAARGTAVTQQAQAEATKQGNINSKIQEMLEEEEAQQMIDAARTGNADQVVEGAIDRNALGDAVQQGIEESISSLKNAMAEALRGGKLDVKGLTEIKAKIEKAQEAAAREKAKGSSSEDVAQVLKDELGAIVTELKGGK
jgi:hypothetical protein